MFYAVLGGFGVLRIAQMTFIVRLQVALFALGLFQVGSKFLDLMEEQRKVSVNSTKAAPVAQVQETMGGTGRQESPGQRHRQGFGVTGCDACPRTVA